MRHWVWLVALLPVPIAAADEAPAAARVRIFHAAPSVAEVSVFVDGELMVEGVAYTAMSSYREVRPGVHNFKLKAAGSPAFLDDRDTALEAGRRYTLAVVARDRAVGFLRIDEPGPPDDAAKASVRPIHLAAAPALEIAPLGDPPIARLAFGQVSPVALLRPEPTTFVVRVVGGDELLRLTKLPLAAGETLSLYLVGRPGGEGAAALQAIVDRQPASEPPAGAPVGGPGREEQPDTRPMVRFGYFGTGPATNVEVDGRAVLREPGYGTVTPYLPLPVGTVAVAVGAGATRREWSVELRATERYTVLLFDAPPHSLWQLGDRGQAAAPASAEVRLVHLASGLASVSARFEPGPADPVTVEAATASSYVAVPPGRPVAVVLRPTGEDTVIRAATLTFSPGLAYTLLITGNATGPEEPGLRFVPLGEAG